MSKKKNYQVLQPQGLLKGHNKTKSSMYVGGGRVEFSIPDLSSFQEYLLGAELDTGVWF